MRSAPNLVCPAASAAGSPVPSCGPSHSSGGGAGRSRYMASSPAYSRSRVNVTMDRAIATPWFPVITMQPLCFHAIANSFPQRRSALRRAFDNLRTVSFVLRGGTPLSCRNRDRSFLQRLCFHTLTNCCSRNSLSFTTIRIARGWTPTLGVRTLTACNVQFVRSATWTRRAHPTIIAARARFQVHG
jgi:hypothetical protein